MGSGMKSISLFSPKTSAVQGLKASIKANSGCHFRKRLYPAICSSGLFMLQLLFARDGGGEIFFRDGKREKKIASQRGKG